MLTSKKPKISVLLDAKPSLGESPVWDPENERLYFIDATGRKIFQCSENGCELRAWTVPARIGSFALKKDGGAIVALKDGFYNFNFENEELSKIPGSPRYVAGTALNDGKVDPIGRFVCGSMDLNEEKPLGSLWQVDIDYSVKKIEEGIICSNGPCWSPEGNIFYFADSFRNRIWSYNYELSSGKITNKKDFVLISDDRGGAPDGATVDSEGCLWSVAVFDGRIRRFLPDGKLDRSIEMPVKKITSLTFGGTELDKLFVTSMAEPPLPKYPDDGPLRGSLFVIENHGVRGLPAQKFGQSEETIT